MDYRRLKTPNKRTSRKHTKVRSMHTNYAFKDSTITHVIGIDECGWGAIAGGLTVGGCVVAVEDDLDWLDVKDSKQYTTQRAREVAYETLLRHQATGRLEFFVWTLGANVVSRGPAQALYACQRTVISALLGCGEVPDRKAGVLVDGRVTIRGLSVPCKAVPKADSIFKVVSAASVAAKVERDRAMVVFDAEYPGYEFYKNKGYPTQEHGKLLQKLGPCSLHRTNIASVQHAARKHNNAD